MKREFFHRDIQLFLRHRVDWERYFRLKRAEPVDVEAELSTFEQILRAHGEICEEIEEDAAAHWHDEVRLEGGEVIPPPHIQRGYERLREAGLVCLVLGPEYGGYGLPYLLNTAYLEMLARADASLMTIVGLQAGVAGDIQRYGSEEIRRRYLPRFARGELQGAMDLTEPNAGSDLGGIRTRATEEDGRWFVDGGKIFITNGGSDVHLVLARDAATFEQSKGTTNGLDLILCPRVLPDGRRNGVSVSRVELKMGIHGSPTCAVDFDHAEGFLLGERGQGFRAMLDLMNQARLGVAAQGIGIAEAAYRQARAYASQRIQFGAPIVEQPLVKQMLARMALQIESARALLYRTAALVDQCEAIRCYLESGRDEPDLPRGALEEELERNSQLIRFFTPLCKYYATEIANDVTRKGIQVHGGLGYMAESRAAHYHSDSIITTIYEGTSEIQASFALREMGKGALPTALEEIRSQLEGLGEEFPDLVGQVADGIRALTDSLPALLGDLRYALLNAKRVSDMVIDVLVAAELLFQAAAIPEKSELATAFVHLRMLHVDLNARRIQSGDASRLERYDRILGL